MNRQIELVLPANRLIDDGDMLLRRALPARERASLGPFVFIDHYRHRSARGIGERPHPHAGIEIVSYLLEGAVEHRDSMGFRDALGPGDAQWIRAGRGMLHAERPGGARHGLQLWTALPPAQKLAAPQYRSFRRSEIPAVAESGATVRVVCGRVAGASGPVRLATHTVFAHLEIAPCGTLSLPVERDCALGAYVLDGEVNIDSTRLGPGCLGILSHGDSLRLTAGSERAEVALLGGAAVEGPILFSGPFVMDTEERLAQAQRDFAEGKMGRLEGTPF
jgi:quercetin 2,3-dioxygenase